MLHLVTPDPAGDTHTQKQAESGIIGENHSPHNVNLTLSCDSLCSAAVLGDWIGLGPYSPKVFLAAILKLSERV